MRHAVFGQRLGRDINSRKALLANLASSLITNGQITTTLAKAKFARSYVEKLITRAKKNRLSTNRILAASLTSAALVKITNQIGPGFKNRSGGYTRIIKLGQRRGDAAPMAKLELLEWEKPAKSPQPAKTKKPVSKAVKASKKEKKAKTAVVKNQKSKVKIKKIKRNSK